MTIQQMGSENMTIKIEGKIAGRQVAELDRAWRELAPALGEKKLNVNLCGVTFMDGNGNHLLAEIYEKTGAEFIADTPLSKYFAQQARQSSRSRNGQGLESNSELSARRKS
ncbi:MAG TPA: hypothetical protein VK709_13075 [Candidatus Saccharimonadales bacterium]|nr:hypothetical protein [Candidatus Saccharimonadales bacterium]